MSRDLDVLRTEGGPRLLLEFLVVLAVLAAVDYLVVVPALQTAAPDLFAQAGVDYGRWDFPDTPLEYVHMGFLLVTFGSFFYWRLYRTALGQRFRESYLAQR